PHLIPIAALHAPSPPKPRKTASQTEHQNYRMQARQQSLAQCASNELLQMSTELAAGTPRRIHALVDGNYTNKTLLRPLPSNVTLIGRIRKDAKLHWLPEGSEHNRLGRRRRYGAQAPTPEQLRQDDAIPWQTVEVVATGKTHQCRIKTI